jgi:hypothetical protein
MNDRQRFRLERLREAAYAVLDDVGEPQEVGDTHLCVLGMILVGMIQILDRIVAKERWRKRGKP